MEIIVLIAVAGAIFAHTLTKKGKQNYLDSLYHVHAQMTGVPAKLLKAVAIIESGENPEAVNPTDPSYGLMQLLCQENGSGVCTNKLYLQDWPPTSKAQLFDPNYSLLIASQILKSNIASYGLKKGIAVYNSWSARHDPSEGPFRNQVYVDKVMKEYARLGNTFDKDL